MPRRDAWPEVDPQLIINRLERELASMTSDRDAERKRAIEAERKIEAVQFACRELAEKRVHLHYTIQQHDLPPRLKIEREEFSRMLANDLGHRLLDLAVTWRGLRRRAAILDCELRRCLTADEWHAVYRAHDEALPSTRLDEELMRAQLRIDELEKRLASYTYAPSLLS